MAGSNLFGGLRVWLTAAMSSAVLGAPAFAHEVTPSIADLTVVDGQVTVDLRTNVEAFVAGIDLTELADTNDAAEAGEYDRLRAMTPDALKAEVQRVWPRFAADLLLTTDQGDMAETLSDLTIEPEPDLELPRSTVLHITAALPAGASALQIGWPASYGALVVRQQGVEEPYTGYLTGGDPSDPIMITGGQSLSGFEAFTSYIPVGFDHILPQGLDHILFVLGLFFLSTRMRPLLWQVSAFTIAHTVTLALGIMGLVSVPSAIVEPLIAASIAFVAIENIKVKGLSPWRPVVVFGFGLLHGLGFASVLGEFGLPQAQFVPALIGFNVGVEVGQLTVISLAYLAVGLWFGDKPWYRRYISNPASAVIGLIGLYWVIERTFLA
ncbi:HupE/UreJ family protein [Donghicola sp. C2-DW-16]|uniref:HupE/UreJ family protein n=1 Tax=Donghicola mangrovi TaxID=2729614 RepID=A0ABX2PFD4_9RHOB|nr:HupE/UreJ family protein [Donghicola mangrovi]NVO27890.1 HupE/UreJ family protein [Donghicola mangrovi]